MVLFFFVFLGVKQCDTAHFRGGVWGTFHVFVMTSSMREGCVVYTNDEKNNRYSSGEEMKLTSSVNLY